jgi:hypothetical protein
MGLLTHVVKSLTIDLPSPCLESISSLLSDSAMIASSPDPVGQFGYKVPKLKLNRMLTGSHLLINERISNRISKDSRLGTGRVKGHENGTRSQRCPLGWLLRECLV